MNSKSLTLALLGSMLLLTLSGFATTSCTSRRSTADLVIRAHVIYTAHPARPKAEAVAIRGGRIIDVGRKSKINRLIGKNTEVLDFKHGVIVPGLIDAHAHLAGLGKALSELDLNGTTSRSEVRDLVLQAISTTPEGEWVEGRGWDQNDWVDTSFPNWRDLRNTNQRPVALRRVDGHALWANQAAMRIAGITSDTPDPKGGRIVHDGAGQPTGVFVDNAMDLITRHIPKADASVIRTRIERAQAECNRFGLAAVHDASVDSLGLAVYRQMAEEGALTLRVYAMLDGSDPVFVEQEMLRGPQGSSTDMLRVRAVKLIVDGALGSRGALLLEPYTDDPENNGLLISTRENLARLTGLAIDRGFQVAVHAIGDSANRVMLDVYKAALIGRNPEDLRLRIEHAQILDSLDIPRFGEQGVIASMQPRHATSDMPWAADRLGEERVAEGAYAWRSILEMGGKLAFGSDFPVEPPNPLLGMYSAVTRQDEQGQPEGGWYPEQRLTMEEALLGFTHGAAYAEFAERVRGTIEKGKLADFTVLDKDPFEGEPSVLLETKVLATIVDGRVVFDFKQASPSEK